MGILDTILRNRAAEQESDMGSIGRGLGTIQEEVLRQDGIKRKEAELNRPVAHPIQKFLEYARAGKMTFKEAATAYKMTKHKLVAPDAFDADPNTPGIQTPAPDSFGGYAGGAPPGQPGAPGTTLDGLGSSPLVQGPTSFQNTHQDQGGLAAPEQYLERRTDAPAALQPHTWTVRDIQDMQQAQQAFPSPKGLTLEDKLMLQADLFGRKGSLQDDNQAAAAERQGNKLSFNREQLAAQMENAEKNRQNAVYITQLKLSQSDKEFAMKSGNDRLVNLIKIYERKQANITNNLTRLGTSINTLAQDPTAAGQVESLNAALDEANEDAKIYWEQIQKEMGTGQRPPETTVTGGSSRRPTPEARAAAGGQVPNTNIITIKSGPNEGRQWDRANNRWVK